MANPTIITAPSGFEASYNGFTFDQYAVTTGFRAEPVEDATGMTVAYTRFTIEITTWLTGSPLDAEVETARRQLSKFGGAFRYKGRGLGDLSINVGETVRDVKFGPKPRVVSLDRFTASKRACRLVWAVEVCVPDCSDATYKFAGMSLSTRVEFRHRKSGRTDRQLSGELTIPNNRLRPGSRKLLDNPDAYLEQVVTPVPRGFVREYAPHSIDATRTKLTFGWTDKEFGGAVYPPGVVGAKASQRTRSTGRGLVTYETTLHAEYELDAAAPVMAAVKAFFELVKARMVKVRQQYGPKVAIFPIYFDTDEADLYDDPKASFTLTWVVKDSSVKNILTHSGMWRPAAEGADWDGWFRSVKDSGQHPRGYSRMVFTTNEDRIVDLCGPEEDQGNALPPVMQAEMRGVFQFPAYNGSGWLHYENHIRVEGDTGIAEMRSLPQGEVTLPPPVPNQTPLDGPEMRSGGVGVTPPGPAGERELRGNPNANFGGRPRPPGFVGPPSFDEDLLGGLNDLNDGLKKKLQEIELRKKGLRRVAGTKAPKAPQQGPVPQIGQGSGRIETDLAGGANTTQKRTGPGVWVFMYGRALRAGFPVPCPELKEVEGVKLGDGLEPANRPDMGEGFTSGVVGNVGVPLYGAKWNLRYWLAKIPDKPIVPPENPMMGDYRQQRPSEAPPEG